MSYDEDGKIQKLAKINQYSCSLLVVTDPALTADVDISVPQLG